MRRVLPVIVIAQFFCTSLWFAGNAIMPEIVKKFQLAPTFVAHLTSAVQFGFITGTLIFALFTIADRFSPSRIFFISSIVAAVFNLGLCLNGIPAGALLLLRFLTGFFLAGIYPIGMKIAADHYREGLGRSLGFLVGALVIGTALPHLLKSVTANLPWRYVIYFTSSLSVLGGSVLLFLVPDGPYRKQGVRLNITGFLQSFKDASFRSAAFGYFGHMWELYAFWTFVPMMITGYNLLYPDAQLNVSLWSFIIIASGGVACVFSGIISSVFGPFKIAFISLSLSGLCCLGSPFFLTIAQPAVLICVLIFWGMTVVADSPLFSTLVAQNAPATARGTALTIVNCIGFSITIVSIQLVNILFHYLDKQFIYLLLAPGPIVGLAAMLLNRKRETDAIPARD
ncbi:MAG: MFS transporter [Ferruginibacter sp.]